MAAKKLTVLDDPTGYIRDNPARFFLGGTYTAVDLVALLVREAMAAGAPQVSVARITGWFVVFSDFDWLQVRDDPWVKIVPFPEGGQNVMRVEILAAVFAERVATSIDGAVVLVKGELDAELSDWLRSRTGRAVAFF